MGLIREKFARSIIRDGLTADVLLPRKPASATEQAPPATPKRTRKVKKVERDKDGFIAAISEWEEEIPDQPEPPTDA